MVSIIKNVQYIDFDDNCLVTKISVFGIVIYESYKPNTNH